MNANPSLPFVWEGRSRQLRNILEVRELKKGMDVLSHLEFGMRLRLDGVSECKPSYTHTLPSPPLLSRSLYSFVSPCVSPFRSTRLRVSVRVSVSLSSFQSRPLNLVPCPLPSTPTTMGPTGPQECIRLSSPFSRPVSFFSTFCVSHTSLNPPSVPLRVAPT